MIFRAGFTVAFLLGTLGAILVLPLASLRADDFCGLGDCPVTVFFAAEVFFTATAFFAGVTLFGVAAFFDSTTCFTGFGAVNGAAFSLAARFLVFVAGG